MLLVGRSSKILVNLVVQALVVRALTKTEFGAFAYALSLTQSAAVFLTLGIDHAVPRFVAIYDERGDRGRLVGVIVLQLCTIVSLGGFVVIAVIGFQGYLSGHLIGDQQVVAVLVVMAVLAPVQALDQLAVSLFAVYARARAIFVRRYVLEPLCRIAVIALLVMAHAGPSFLAAGYVLTGVLGIVLYTSMLLPLLRAHHVLPLGRDTPLRLPWKEVLAFSLPLMSTDLLYATVNTIDVVLIRRHSGGDAVAAYRAVQPFAKMNQFVMTSFALLYTPMMSRLMDRGDRRSINELYWTTAAWITVMSFPIFTLTFSLAEPLTRTALGSAYSGSAIYLMLLSVGYYVNAAFGFNGLTVKLAGRVRYTVVISLVALLTNVGLNLVLIPTYGALGAAVANLSTMVLHNLLKHFGLRLTGSVELVASGCGAIYFTVVAWSCALLVIQQLFTPPVLVALLAAAAASVSVVLVARRRLDVMMTFPELGHVPLLGRLLGARR